MRVLVDIGNTRIKWAVEVDNNVQPSFAINYKTADLNKVIEANWSKLSVPKVLAISSVSATLLSQQIIAVAKRIWPDIQILKAKSSPQACSISNAYQQAEKLGVDRWLGLIALHHHYQGVSCIVDCGTAITIDFLDAGGQHLGGIISPGIQLMKKALFQGTEELSFINQKYDVGLASNTESAIYTGALYAAVGLIEKTINEFKHAETIVLTGGDAELIKQYLQNTAIIEPDIVLKGLSLYCEGEGMQ